VRWVVLGWVVLGSVSEYSETKNGVILLPNDLIMRITFVVVYVVDVDINNIILLVPN